MKDLAERIAALSPEHRALFIKQLEQMGVEIPPLEEEKDDSIPPRGHNNPSPLSIDQERLWFFNQMEPDNPTYNVYSALRMIGKLDVAALRYSLNQIINRHEAWRTTFHMEEGKAVQIVAPTAEFAFEEFDLSDLPLEEREAKARLMSLEQAQKPFDLANGPIVRAALIHIDEEDAIFVLTIHHIVMDRVSFSIFFKEMMLNYESYQTGKPVDLPELTVHYADYAEWQRRWLEGPEVAEKLDYWKKQLADSEFVLNLPTDYPRKTQQRYKGNRQFFQLAPDLFEGIKALARKEGSTANMLFLAAFKALLYRYTGQRDIIVGVPVGNRTKPEVEDILGYFLTTSALRTDVTGEMNFRELLKKVREVSLGAYRHQDLPFGLLLDELKPERDPSRNPVFQVCFVYVDVPEDPFTFPGVEVLEDKLDGQTAKFDMTLGVIENEGGASLMEYNVDLFKPETIARVIEHFVALLESIVAHPEMPIGQLPMLTAKEREQLLIEWN
ncbi:MAG: condensation domain-containing protein, partial [Tumebacillaceae bacterium]